jgi:hypothetical protein
MMTRSKAVSNIGIPDQDCHRLDGLRFRKANMTGNRLRQAHSFNKGRVDHLPKSQLAALPGPQMKSVRFDPPSICDASTMTVAPWPSKDANPHRNVRAAVIATFAAALARASNRLKTLATTLV